MSVGSWILTFWGNVMSLCSRVNRCYCLLTTICGNILSVAVNWNTVKQEISDQRFWRALSKGDTGGCYIRWGILYLGLTLCVCVCVVHMSVRMHACMHACVHAQPKSKSTRYLALRFRKCKPLLTLSDTSSWCFKTETTLSRDTMNLCTHGTTISCGTKMDDQPQATAAPCIWHIPCYGGGCQRQTEHTAAIPHQWK
jgi:hypothetical protein